MSEKQLTEKQKIFCREYIYDWNATRAYKVAYPNVTNNETAASNGSRMLRNDKVSAYIEEIKTKTAEMCGISRNMVAERLKQHAFSSIAHLHNSWITRKEFDELTDEQKNSISEISTSVKKIPGEGGSIMEVEYVKIKLYDSQKALEMLSKMLGYNEPEKHDHTSKGESINIINLGSGKKDE